MLVLIHGYNYIGYLFNSMLFEQVLPYLLKGHKIYREGMEEDNEYYQFQPSVGSYLVQNDQVAEDAHLGQVGLFKRGYFLDEASFSSSDVLAADWFVIGIPAPELEEEEKENEETVQSPIKKPRRTKTPFTDSE